MKKQKEKKESRKQEKRKQSKKEHKTKREKTKQEKKKRKFLISLGIILGLVFSVIVYIFTSSLISALMSLGGFVILFFLYLYFRTNLKNTARIKKMEQIFPDFLQLMASNLRAGMTIDKAMLLSSRKEFSPLDQEILQAGKDITTGKDIETSLLDLSKRIGSEKIKKTIMLIISGLKAGGNVAILLEETAVNMRERGFVEKRAASSVLMYMIFIFLAVSFFAPGLFSLSTILVEVLSNLLSGIPATEASVNLPFTLSTMNVSTTFIKYFSIAFIIAIDILACLVLGLVNKGEEKQGLKYLPIILALSLGVFFAIRFFLSSFLSGLFT